MDFNSCEHCQPDIYKGQKEALRFKVFEYYNSSFTEKLRLQIKREQMLEQSKQEERK